MNNYLCIHSCVAFIWFHKEITELERLEGLCSLIELSVINNAVRVNTLQINISNNSRARSKLYGCILFDHSESGFFNRKFIGLDC